jgi:aerobic-type carbon monoxide dehydrogenase small subunit (CoxS/CutS family)
VGNNLLTFLANRLNMSFTNLNCQNFGLKNPVTVTLNGNAVAIAATFNTAAQKATAATTPAMPAGGQRAGRPGHRLMNPSGT